VSLFFRDVTLSKYLSLLSGTAAIKRSGLCWLATMSYRFERNAGTCAPLFFALNLTLIKTTWPSAGRAWDLLNGVRVQVDSNMPPLVHGPDRQKRAADDAFGEKRPDVLQREAFSDLPRECAQQNSGIQEISTRMMAHMLGLDIPGIEPSTSYYPGYEWWPRTNQPPQSYHESSADTASLMNMNYPPPPNDQDWRIQNPTSDYTYEYQNAPPGHYRM
jgi:hypothetical protein